MRSGENSVFPKDQYNQQLINHVHPQDWTNPKPSGRYNVVVIGAGTAGLVTAIGAAGLGAKVALIEKHLMGGDCLNVGCVPSKALIRSARLAADLKKAGVFGINIKELEIDFPAVMQRMRLLRAQISPNDSARRYQKLGVDVFFGQACFTGSQTIAVADQMLTFKKAVIATGARAVLPSIEGLEEQDLLTNETIFNLTERPRRLAVIGGGPIGSELAQTFQRLGSQVTLLHNHAHILDREDDDAAEIVQNVFLKEGLDLRFDVTIEKVEKKGREKKIYFKSGASSDQVTVDAILVGAGRQPNVDDLGLEQAGVTFDQRSGIQVNDQLQTSNRAIYAVGDCCMKWKFTHAADAAAKVVIQNALFGGRKKLSALTMPWATYTDPEIAHVGLYAHEAKAQGLTVETYIRDLAEVDRAILDGEDKGFVKIHVKQGSDQIVGATVVAKHAGDLISELSVAMAGKVGLGTLYGVIHPYPTQAESIKQAAAGYMRTKLTPFVKKLFEKWLAWSR